MKKLLLITAAVLFLAGNAFAFPTVDGTNGGGEWTSGLVINGFDPNEVAITNAYDMSRVAMILESSGGVNDGLYVLVELYDTPTFTSLGFLPVVYLTALDMNLDGDFMDSVDRALDYRTGGLLVYNGTGASVAGSPTAVMGSVVEMYIPSSMFASFPPGGFNTFSQLDNGGGEPDDLLPDVGYNTTVPEPTTTAMLGLGLFGIVGALIRRKKARA